MLLSGLEAHHIQSAAEHLAAGELIGLPTETVYGLGARADDDAAVGRIFEAKGRPPDHPLIVHVRDAESASRFAADLNQAARRLIDALWPGPLTVIVRREPGVATAAAGGQGTIGLRCPSHPVAQDLLEAACGLGVFGVAAPSANRFGRISPTSAAHVAEEFGPELLVLDGGDCALGIESSIVDCSRKVPVLLRPGVLTRAQIEAVLGESLGEVDGEAPKASGTLAAHYAPRAIVRLFSSAELLGRLAEAQPLNAAIYARVDLLRSAETEPGAIGSHGLFRPMPGDAGDVAHELFAVLRSFDAAGAAEIWIQEPPDQAEWEGVRDRLSRAAAATVHPPSHE